MRCDVTYDVPVCQGERSTSASTAASSVTPISSFSVAAASSSWPIGRLSAPRAWKTESAIAGLSSRDGRVW